jgi:putative transcriptional regulator
VTITHHPSDATLIAYGAGGLPERPALVVATHVSLCRICREKLRDVDALGGVLLELLPPSEMATDAFACVMARLGEPDAPPVRTLEARRPSPTRGGMATPEPLRRYLGGDIKDVRWRALLPGIRYVEVMPRTPDGGNVMLLRVAPGMALGLHGHRGSEQTVILAGTYSDAFGRFGAGDFCETDETVTHQPIADLDEDCICLICTEAPLRYDGWLARMLQPFLRI